MNYLGLFLVVILTSFGCTEPKKRSNFTEVGYTKLADGYCDCIMNAMVTNDTLDKLVLGERKCAPILGALTEYEIKHQPVGPGEWLQTTCASAIKYRILEHPEYIEKQKDLEKELKLQKNSQ